MLDYNHIKSLAEKRGLSLEILGPKIKLTPEGFRKALRNETITLKHAVLLTKQLHCSLNELVGVKKEYPVAEAATISSEPNQSWDYEDILKQNILHKQTIIDLQKKIIHLVEKTKSPKSHN